MVTGSGTEPRSFLGRVAGLAALVALLAGCTPSEGEQTATGVYRLLNSARNPAIQTMEHSAELLVVPPSRALVHIQDTMLVLERNMGAALEQRIFIPNGTAIRGDNVLYLRAQTDISARPHEFNFAEISARLGGLPTPFERTNLGGLLSGSDSMGSYVYVRENLGIDTVCVLVMRRVTGNARPMPRGVHAIDIILRNCVVGSLEQALAPMGDRALAQAAAPQGTVYTLSPFAAPTR